MSSEKKIKEESPLHSIAFPEGVLSIASRYGILRFLWDTTFLTLISVITYFVLTEQTCGCLHIGATIDTWFCVASKAPLPTMIPSVSSPITY